MGLISQSLLQYAQYIYSTFFPVTALSNEIKKSYSPFDYGQNRKEFNEKRLVSVTEKIFKSQYEESLKKSNSVFKSLVFFGKKFDLKENIESDANPYDPYVRKNENFDSKFYESDSLKNVVSEVSVAKGYPTRTLNRQAIQGALITAAIAGGTAAAVGGVWYMIRKS